MPQTQTREEQPVKDDAPTQESTGLANSRLVRWVERIELMAYVGVAIVLLVAAGAVLAYGVIVVPEHVRKDGFLAAIIELINNLLLVVIVLEVLRTLLGYVQSHMLSVKPFLLIAAISATRRILTLGAGMAIEEQEMETEQFNRALLDLGVNAAIILVVAIALRLTSAEDRRSQR